MAVLNASLNENGSCKYDISNVSYSLMGSTMTALNGTHFTASMTASEGANNYFIACQDLAGNENVTNVSFTVSTVAPVINATAPSGYVNSRVNLSVTTNENSICRYDTSDKEMHLMTYAFGDQTLKTNHSANASSLYTQGTNIF